MIPAVFHQKITRLLSVLAMLSGSFLVLSCAQVEMPGARSADIPSPVMADKREQAVNEKPDSVLYLPLGSDVLVPQQDKTLMTFVINPVGVT